MSMMEKVNIKKISELSGFSPATVSNALNNKRGVNSQTAEKILAIARELGYAKEEKIKNIQLVIYHDSGKVVSDVPFFTSLLDALSNASHKKGYATKLINLYRNDDDYEEQLRAVLQDVSSAILLVGTELDAESAKRFLQAEMPLVLLDCSFQRLPFNAILMDNANAMRQAVDYLVSLGHKDIGYLHSETPTQVFEARRHGYIDAMQEHGLLIDKDFCFGMPVSITEAYNYFNEILAKQPKLPTAFLAANDMIAIGVMQALQKNNIKVPEDISIIGFDDIEISSVMAPGLTTVKVDTWEMGQMAVRRLLNLIKQPQKVPARVELYTELMVRGSTAAPSKQEKGVVIQCQAEK